MSIKKIVIGAVIVIVILIALQPRGTSKSPIDRLTEGLKDVPEYSIILEDMQVSGNFTKHCYHKYKVTINDEARYTDFVIVPESFYMQNENNLGMTLLSKTPDGDIKTPAPPGYQYVGNPRYGEWKTDSSGNSFWAFYGQYMFMSHLFGMVNRPVYRNDYDTFNSYRTSSRPYYGSNNQYGTNGTATRQTHKSFFERKMARQRMARQSFGQKVRQRVGRSRSPFRSRGGGFGK